MITAKLDTGGTLYTVRAECETEQDLITAKAAMNKFGGGRNVNVSGQRASITCRRADAQKIMTAISRPAETAQQAARASYVLRVLYAERQTAPLTVEHKGRTIKFTGYGKSFRISEDHPSYEGSHLLGCEGEYGRYAYYR